MPPNPLSEANPFSLEELMSRDPLGYQRKDRDKIIEELRKQRARYGEQEAKPKAAKKAKGSASGLSLKDLGLE